MVKPDATEALFRQVREGTAIINYIGHGSEHQWAQERLLFQDRGDVARIQTGMKLHLWIAGTCSWGHFDYVDNEAFSEELIRRPRDGAAAIITTSRLITVSSNQYYTEQIFRSLFPHHRVTRQPLGDILQSVKTGNADGELFHLFGDPALHIALAADTLDRIEVDRDTLQALAVATYTGSQSVLNGPGYGFVTLRDADRPVTRHYSFLNTEQSLSFVLPGPTLFRGQISFTGNQLQGQVRLPNDLSYSAAPGYLSLYIYSTETGFQEALGSRGNIYFQGGLPTQDHSGPIIQFETDSGRRLGPGDHLNPDDRLWVRLTDPLGINLTGEIGHTIEWTRVDRGETIDITDRFVYDLNSITTGTIEILSDEYSSGETVRVQAWDSANNPADAEITLYRITQSALRLLNVLNFPNPFHSATDFTFEISAAADVTVDIYTLNGRRLVRLGPRPFPPGFATLHWDGRDQWGNRLANGVYLYRIQAKNQSESVSRIERCAKYE
ncbi:MAG: T9SS C-terminal target domain-containing protein [Candidatus Neomarinimicrobiota bacterium]|nr:MAG: T9SS C-terminal target domain-containing protein [Candidatus Neomarinimicrobiota bacterium]